MPAISSISPGSLTAGAKDTVLAISGTGFISSSVAQWNGVALATTYTSASSVSATVPASNLADGSVASVTVVNPSPGGGASAATQFSVNNPAPVIASVSPATVTAGAGATSVDVKGGGFVKTSTITWNGAPLTTTFVSGTELQATIPAASLAGSLQASIAVQSPTPGGGTSPAAAFVVKSPAPTISSLSPRYVAPGAAATITLNGTGFESNSVVQWNGSPRPTTFVSPTALKVALTAADLQNQGNGFLSVNNPAPGSATSASVSLAISSQPPPTITSVTIAAAAGFNTPCQQLRVTVTGQNFTFYSSIQANGNSLVGISGNGSTMLSGLLPLGFLSQPGALSFTVTNLYPTLASDPYAYPASAAPAMALCASPSPTTVYAGSSFSIAVQPSEVNLTGNGTVTLGALPAGITAAVTSATLPQAGATLHLQAAANTAAGTYNIPLNGAAGTASATANFQFTIGTGTPPSIFFAQPIFRELGVPIGGSGQIQFQSIVNSSSSVDFEVIPSVSGLPPGTTASVSPNPFLPGDSVTVTVTAAANAPVTQNATVTLTGTPTVAVPAATIQFYLDVTQPPGSLPGNRTDFTSTGATPFAAVYDPVHDLVFASNPAWNRVDVLSNKTHQVVKSIPVPSPRGLDITQDNSLVWVVTASQQVYALNTANLTATRYLLPRFQNAQWNGNLVEVLSDGTLLLETTFVAVWDPKSNVLTPLGTPVSSIPGLGWGPMYRTGDGSKVFSFNANSSNCQVLEYDVASKTVTAPGIFTEVCGFYAVNQDGSRLVAANGAAVGLYDGSFNLLGTIFPANPAVFGYFSGSFIFSRDGSQLYEVSQGRITTIDTATANVLGTAPGISTMPINVSQTPILTNPTAVDANQMLIGIQNYGIAFEDASFYQNYGTNTVSGYSPVSLTPYSGPLSGGTQVSPYGAFDLTPDVWFGPNRGTAAIDQSMLTITTPPSSVAGPVNMKYLFPDGQEIFSPWEFTYSTFPQYALTSGGSPLGGEPGTITGYGLPSDPSLGTLSVGGNGATITTTTSQYLPFTGEPFPSTFLNFTVPPGTPGPADIAVTTPAGTGTLPKAFFYAKSVTDYASTDTLTAVLVDAKRSQVYLAAGDHVDVFSTASNKFVSPLYPPAQGAQKQFTGLALTPDGSQLLVTDLLDGSLAVINPDSPAGSYAIPIAAAAGVGTTCAVGPLYVAATANNQAFVITGGLPAQACPSAGVTYIVNLQSKAVTRPNAWAQCGIGLLTPPFTDGFSADASGDGNLIAIGGSDYNRACLYSVPTNTYAALPFFPSSGNGIGISSDGTVMGSYQAFVDNNANLLGTMATPIPVYRGATQYPGPPYPLLRPRLNASGSLYYIAYPDYFEIIDVAHATLRMRFSLTEKVQSTGSPIAIDSGGRFVYLITDQGLTVVDLGAAPLSIGHLSLQSAGAGTQIVVRGSGFDAGTTAMVGGVAATVSFTDENTLTLTMPALASGPHDIVLTRTGGETYTLENSVMAP